MTRARLRGPAPLRVLFDGQSHNIWPDATVGDGIGPYPDRLMAEMPGVPWANVAVAGQGWQTLSGTASTRLWPQARPTGTDLLVMCGGQHDLIDGATPEQTYERAVAYSAAARTAGFGLVAATTMPAIHPGLISPERVAAHNSLLVADADGAFDAVARWDLAPELSDPSDRAYYWTDQIHLDVGGAEVAAAVTLDAIQPLITP